MTGIVTTEEPTPRWARRVDPRKSWVPLTIVVSVIGTLIVIGVPAVATWATDRSMLFASHKRGEEHEQRLRALEQTSTRQTVVLEGILQSLQSIDRKLEKRP